MNRTTRYDLVLFLCVTSTATAGVIHDGTDPDHVTAALGRNYSASLWDVTNPNYNVGNVTLLDLPWTNKPFVAGPKHALDYTGQTVNEAYEVRFGNNTLNSSDEVIAIKQYHLKGTGGLYTVDDFFIAELDHWPASVDPIPLYLEGFNVGQEGEFTGVGDVYIGNGGFAYFDGNLRTGRFVVDEINGGYIESEMFPLGDPTSDPFDMGGAPGYSGSVVEMLRSDGQLGMAAMANYINGTFNLFVETNALRMDEVFPFIQSVTVPEPASLTLLAIGALVVVRRRG